MSASDYGSVNLTVSCLTLLVYKMAVILRCAKYTYIVTAVPTTMPLPWTTYNVDFQDYDKTLSLSNSGLVRL